MLAAKQRMRRRGDFTTAMRRGRRVNRGSLVVHLAIVGCTVSKGPTGAAGQETSASAPHPVRVGFVVPKTVGGAVVRNRVRRRLRHLVRERLDKLPAGALLVVRALPAAADTPYARLGEQLDAALHSLRRPATRSTGDARRPADATCRGGTP